MIFLVVLWVNYFSTVNSIPHPHIAWKPGLGANAKDRGALVRKYSDVLLYLYGFYTTLPQKRYVVQGCLYVVYEVCQLLIPLRFRLSIYLSFAKFSNKH